MKVSIIGAGYVGLVTGACFGDMGNDVVCLDVDPSKVEALRSGRVPIYEPGLDELIKKNSAAGRLRFTTDYREAVQHAHVLFIAVGTPPDEDGSADLKYVISAARSVGRCMDSPLVIANKSTVPVGTADKVRAAIREELLQRGAEIPFSVVSNPEFLKEGAAIDDFMKPDRVVVGGDDQQAIDVMRRLYAPFSRNHDKFVVMDVRSAELTKYAANAMLATRISFMNELANLAEALGADIEAVRHGIGSDSRIGTHFLYAGCGYGGSCFPKDVQALIRTASEWGCDLRVLQAVESANEAQKQVLCKKLHEFYQTRGGLSGKTIGLWGLAFKPGTDDMREAPSRALVTQLLQAGARIKAYDPVAQQEARRIFGDATGLQFCESAKEAVEGSDALVIVTEWKEFRSPDFEHMKLMLRDSAVFDGRNLFEPGDMQALGLYYSPVGRNSLRHL